MQKRYTQFLAACSTARQFLDAKDASLGPINASGARKSFDGSIETIQQLAVEQDRHRMLVTGQRNDELRLAGQFRRKYLRPVVEIVQAKLPDETELLSEVKLPRGYVSSTSLAAKGHAMASAVAPFAQIFTDAGLPADFLAQLGAAADELTGAVSKKGNHRANRRGATDGLDKSVQKARKAVRVLDAMLRAELPLDEPLVTEWREAVRVIRGGVRPRQLAALPTVA